MCWNKVAVFWGGYNGKLALEVFKNKLERYWIDILHNRGKRLIKHPLE